MSVINEKILRKVSNKPQKIARLKLLVLACFLGIVMGVVFIIIQPLFGMDTLTSRHADAYQKIGSLSNIAAISIAWLAHMLVSVFYGLLCGLVLIKTSQLKTIALLTLVFTWLTTIIAPPANAMIVQMVSFQHIQFNKLPSLNFSFDVKFVLHLVFFAAISGGLYIYQKRVS